MKPTILQRPAAIGNYAKSRRLPISQITFHHIVGDAPGAISRFQTAGVQVSSTYVISSTGVIYQCVAEEDTPYTDANSDSNARSITIEHAGGHASVPYTEAMYKASTELVRYLIGKYNISRFERHRDVSDTPTACPGALDVERIIRDAKQGENNMIQSNQDVDLLFLAVLNGYPADDTVRKRFIGMTWPRGLQALRESAQYLSQNHILLIEYPALKEQLRNGSNAVTREAVVKYVQENLK